MYDDLILRLRDAAKMSEALAILLPHGDGNVTAKLFNEAADAIEELSKDRDNWKATAKEEREAYQHWFDNYQRDVPNWIPVTERLPEPYTWVLVSAEGPEVAFDAFYDGAQWKDAILNGLIVTHWMPLPQPPEEE